MVCDLLIFNGTILPINSDVIHNGFVAIRNGVIVDIGRGRPPFQATKLIDAAKHIVMPGMVNCHTHLPMTLYRGIGNDRCHIFKLMFPLEKACTSEEMCIVGAELGAIELIRSGVTCFADMYYFEDKIAEVISRVGLRAILGETIIHFSAPDAPTPYGGFDLAKKFIAKWKDHPRITPAFAPHAPYTVDNEMYMKIQAEPDAPILTHLAEIRDHPRDCVDTLNQIGLLTNRLITAHCIFVTDSDIEELRKNQVGVGLNMKCNAKGGGPTGPSQKMFNAALRVGLGSDGAMSSNTADILSQMSFASVLQKHDLQDRSAMPAKAIVEMATLGGAKALHLENKIGTLEIGKLADIVIIRNDGPHQIPSYDPFQTLVHATFPTDVRVTIVDGQVLMEDGKFFTVDIEKVHRAAEPIISSIQNFLESSKE